MSQEKKNRLLENAIQLFARDGINETSTGSVARAAGVAAGTLFNYFPTKQDLILAAYVECKTEMARHVRALLEPDLGLKQRMHVIWTGVIEWSLENLEKSDFIIQFKNSPGAYDAHLETTLQNEFGFMHDTVCEISKEKNLSDLPDEYVERIFAALFTATVDYLRQIKPDEREQMIEKSFALIWKLINQSVPA